MCSRFALFSSPDVVRSAFGLSSIETFPPRYNIAPGEPVAIVRPDHAGQPAFRLVLWGLHPSWSRKPPEKPHLFNARAETAATRPAYRGALRHRRCLIPADSFYVWTGTGRARSVHRFSPRVGGPMALAGLFEHWLGADGSELETMAILTVAANATVQHFHPRMPAIIQPAAFARWLDCSAGDGLGLDDLLAPAPDDLLQASAANPALADPAREGVELLGPGDDRLL
jgi:putative SOS response-associated peptidase YedK